MRIKWSCLRWFLVASLLNSISNLIGVAGLQCYTNNFNNWTMLPSNNVTIVQCGPLEQCGAFKFKASKMSECSLLTEWENSSFVSWTRYVWFSLICALKLSQEPPAYFKQTCSRSNGPNNATCDCMLKCIGNWASDSEGCHIMLSIPIDKWRVSRFLSRNTVLIPPACAPSCILPF